MQAESPIFPVGDERVTVSWCPFSTGILDFFLNNMAEQESIPRAREMNGDSIIVMKRFWKRNNVLRGWKVLFAFHRAAYWMIYSSVGCPGGGSSYLVVVSAFINNNLNPPVSLFPFNSPKNHVIICKYCRMA
ncbi:MAG: hypothetical protein ACFFB3_21705 [Candidatus Hodarchaeota archaeon]